MSIGCALRSLLRSHVAINNSSARRFSSSVQLADWRRFLGELVFLALLAPLWFTELAHAATRINVCGSITTDTTWTPDKVYVISDCSVTVEPRATLRIEAGTVVKLTLGRFLSGGELIINGQLEAVGTSGAPVVFTSLQDDVYGGDTNGDGANTTGQPGQWSAISFNAGSRGRLTHVIAQYGGGYYYHWDTKAIVRSLGGDVVLDQVTLRRSGKYGLYAENAVSVTRSHIFDNTDWGLYYHIRGTGSGLEIIDNVFSGPAGKIWFDTDPGPVIVQDNRTEGAPGSFSLHGVLRNAFTWENAPNFVMTVSRNFEVAATGSLIIAPGSVVKLTFGATTGGELIINGELNAVGTTDAPVVFTSLQDDEYGGDTNGDGAATTGQPGQWSAITFNPGSRGQIGHAIIRYGGGYYYHYHTKALLRIFSSDVTLENVELTHSGHYGVYAENGPMVLHRCRITDNARHGVFNHTPKLVVDARRNWWGDASGPHHRTKNPLGQGNAVSDGVLFFPWAVDEAGTVPTQVLVEGPTTIAPGDTASYVVSYELSEGTENAVLVVDLPMMGRLVDASGSAVLWFERNQLYWILNNERHAEQSFRILYDWGLPDGSSDNVSARIIADNLGSASDATEYQTRAPRVRVREETLSPAELNAEVAAYPDLGRLFREAIGAGFLAPVATRSTTNLAEEILEILFIHPERGAVKLLARSGATVTGVTYERETFRVYDTRGGLEWDLALDRISFWGAWTEAERAARTARGVLSFSRCFFNCVAPKMTLAVIKKTVKSIGLAFKVQNCFACGLSRGANLEACAKCGNAIKPLVRIQYVPGLGDDVPVLGEMIDVTKCASDCAGQQGVVFPCREDLLSCDSSIARSVWTSVFEQCSFRRIPCQNGLLVPEQSHVVNSGCATDFCKCVEGKGCVRCAKGSSASAMGVLDETARLTQEENCRQGLAVASAEQGGACSIARTQIRAARDPNAKSGPSGDVLPGQMLTYVVEYENVGAGRAYGVYVTDELSVHLDETSLELGNLGQYFPSTRTILWDVGDLAPNGQIGSQGSVTFRVRVKPGVPSGTVIANRAIVHFPSVPEETPTNTVVNVVQPLVALPLSFETFYRMPVAIRLVGQDISGLALRYRIEEAPTNGELRGTAPDLSYVPAENFTGLDRFSYSVDNGVSVSRIAAVTVRVLPSPADMIPPQVVWTYPEDGAQVQGVGLAPTGTDAIGPFYAPFLRVGFSEPLAPETVLPENLQVLGPSGQEVRISVAWDGLANSVVLVPRVPWQRGSYIGLVGAQLRDASGNSLASDYSWSFRVIPESSCVGDCNEDGNVTIDELVKGVNIALGIIGPDQCRSLDANGDGTVTVDELIRAVNNALGGCGQLQS